jgi:hypothetical protein
MLLPYEVNNFIKPFMVVFNVILSAYYSIQFFYELFLKVCISIMSLRYMNGVVQKGL